ncbi:glycoside hydrolase family 15 protein [Nonomuraea sediminis]|uniref:glycoside hydrolase family 15 protein n=1 Tax=Nonomuraea sediminis TaxID=2835864 RepID=UPI001BDD4C9E|nr:glycoside hydrolase family 15 protein [Nonomuraea sediminis]
MAGDGYPAISDYAFLSDCHSLALVGRDASVEWACFHRFDSSPVFARILDRDRGGYFRIAPSGDHRVTRRYLPHTNVLETRFETATGAADHLEGYRGSRPVRIGNGAWNQFQLDIYGELLAAAWFVMQQHGWRPRAKGRFAFIRDVVELNIQRWREPDEGIWEVRGGRRDFVFSKLMAWLCGDCGLRILDLVPDSAADTGLRARWEQARAEIRTSLESRGVDPETGAFLQAYEHDALDASALQVGLRGFLPFDDPRVLATIDRVEAELARNGHVHRYLSDDGLAGDEGSFVFCTLWLVSALARAGRVEAAEAYLARVLDCASDLGLLAEEIDPDTGEQLGNFPQGFSHLGVIAAVLNLEFARDHAAGAASVGSPVTVGTAGRTDP